MKSDLDARRETRPRGDIRIFGPDNYRNNYDQMRNQDFRELGIDGSLTALGESKNPYELLQDRGVVFLGVYSYAPDMSGIITNCILLPERANRLVRQIRERKNEDGLCFISQNEVGISSRDIAINGETLSYIPFEFFPKPNEIQSARDFEESAFVRGLMGGLPLEKRKFIIQNICSCFPKGILVRDWIPRDLSRPHFSRISKIYNSSKGGLILSGNQSSQDIGYSLGEKI